MITWKEVLETPKGETPKSRQQRIVDGLYNGDEQAYLFEHRLSRSNRMKWSHVISTRKLCLNWNRNAWMKFWKSLAIFPLEAARYHMSPLLGT